MITPLLFFDDQCNFCRGAILKLSRLDHQQKLHFSPLRSELAQELLGSSYQELLKANTMVLMEDKKQPLIRSRAFFRILWLLGGMYRLIGALYVLPFGFDWLYRIIANNRNKISGEIQLPDDSRFLM